MSTRYYNPSCGRFLNADAFATNGQGFFGNNMFTYCNNTPSNAADLEGTRMVPVHAEGSAPAGFASPSVVSQNTRPGGRSGKVKPNGKRDLIKDVKRVIYNTSEQKVLDAKVGTFYKGVPVVKLPIGTDAFSFGIIFLGNDVGKRLDAIETVRHEYGHAIHYRMAGALSYTVTAFVPSVIGYHFGGEEYQANYYSQVYEYTADVLGNVNRPNYSYSSTTENWAGAYLLFSMLFL